MGLSAPQIKLLAVHTSLAMGLRGRSVLESRPRLGRCTAWVASRLRRGALTESERLGVQVGLLRACLAIVNQTYEHCLYGQMKMGVYCRNPLRCR